jgi:diacylglycerol diphosphate phosphatase/phosphatidate phosphatase
VLTPSLAAALISGSRIMDARHHPFDVLSGALIGIIFAWVAYRQYFPALHDYRAKGRAFPMRTWGRDPLGKRDADYVYGYQEPVVTSTENVVLTTAPASGNHFRDEISKSQRHRTVQSPRRAAHTGDISEARFNTNPPPPVPAHAPRTPREQEWEDVTVRDGTTPEEYELRPQYSLSGPSGHQLYDPYHTAQGAEETVYRGGGVPPTNPVARLPSMRTPEGAKVFPASSKPGSKAGNPPQAIKDEQKDRTDSF